MWWRGEHTPWASCKGGFIHVNGWKKKKSSLGWDYITMFNWSMGRALMAATSTHRVFHCEGQHKHIVTLSCSLCWWMGPCFTELTKNYFILQVLLLEIPQDFFLLPCEKPSASSLETTTFLVTPHIHTQLLLHYSWHREGMRMGDGKISACFLLLTQKLEKNKQQQQTAQPYNAGIQLCGSHRGFPRQAITLTVYIASQKQLEKL